MLSQVNFWAERAGMVFDLALMLRIVALRLHRTYFFISLFALLSLFYDGVGLALGTESEDYARVVILSKFLYAVIYPLAIWDIFEEAKPIIDKLRKLAMTRMISSLIFISLWGLLIAAFTGGDDGDQSHYLYRLAFVIWTGSVAAAIAFIWVMRRGIRANGWSLPGNTNVWLRFFLILLIIEAITCVIDLVLPSVKSGSGGAADHAAEIAEPILQLAEMALTTWCIWKLRVARSSATDVPANVNS